MIDRELKRSLGQMMKGVQIVTSTHDGLTRGYCSHWVTQISFEEPIVMASVSPKHDTHAVIEASGWFCVSNLAGDQVDVGQYFSYPGRKFNYIADEYLTEIDGNPVVDNCISWFRVEITDKLDLDIDHDLFVGRISQFGEGRLGESPLLYSSRLGWRISGGKARQPGDSIRDRLLERLDGAGGTNDASGVTEI